MSTMSRFRWAIPASLVLLVSLVGCAASAPTATPTQPPAAVQTPTKAPPTPTKAPTATPTKRPLVKMKVAQSVTGLQESALYIARERYFQEEGLDVEWFVTGGGSKTRAALIAGDPPIGTSVAEAVIDAVGQGAPLIMVGALNIGNPNLFVLRKDVAQKVGFSESAPLPQRISLLKGLTFAATSAGAGSDLNLRAILKAGGLDPDRDVTITYMGDIPNMIPALEAGSIDGFLGPPPSSVIPVAKGTAIVAVQVGKGELPQYKRILFNGITANKSLIQSNPDGITAIIRAIWRGEKLLQEDRKTAADIIYKGFFSDLERPLFDQSLELTFSGFAKEPTLPREAVQAAIDEVNERLETPMKLTPDDVATNRFVEEARKQLGF
ncbi:MAG: ABC transporter substrate-binding protein [Chloroflexi bacterium]|nr:ABC transporter substrate-binding protein [Chloroflexota bacterium]